MKTLEYVVNHAVKEIHSEVKELVSGVWKGMREEIKKPKVYKSVGAAALATSIFYSFYPKSLLTCAALGGITGLILLGLLGTYSYYKKNR